MKMKNYIAILWIALTMMGVFSACTNEDSLMTEQTVAKTATIRATIDGNLGSRVALTDDAKNSVVKVEWKQGDDFKINVNDQYYTFTYNSTTTKKFECSDENFPEYFNSDATITATYPATTPTDTEYANQPGTLEGAAALLTMTATIDVEANQSTEDLALNFKHNNSIVKLTLSNEAFQGKSVTGVTLKSGDATVATSTGTFTDDDNNGSIVAYFAVVPQAMENVSILAVCEGSNYTATLNDDKTLVAGKLYNVIKSMTVTVTPMGDITADYAVKGDFAMADGTFISKDATLTDEQKANVRGIVFWTEKEDGRATLDSDVIMKAEFPNCTHGLIVSLKNFSSKWQISSDRVANWQNGENFPGNKNDYKSIASSDGYNDPINFILGYQNTEVLKAYNASLSDADTGKKVLPVSSLETFSTDNPAPLNTTGWFIPSLKELTLLCDKDVNNVWSQYTNSGYTYTSNKQAMNSILKDKLGDAYAEILEDKEYWSSLERKDTDYVFEMYFKNGQVWRMSKSKEYYVRAVCAF